jgi:hypothetical protein
MAAATVEICESYGTTGSESVAHNITNTNMGNALGANIDPVANPITPGNRSYAKYQRIHVTNIGTSSAINNLKVWRTGALGGSATHLTNAGESTAYTAVTTFATPVKTAITDVDNAMPVTTAPTTNNLGIGGDLVTSLTAAGYSDYLVHQIVTDAGDVAGSTSTMSYQYDETA